MYARVGYAHTHREPGEVGRDAQSMVIPRIQQVPGAIGGYWMEPIDGTMMVVLLFASREAAESSLLPQVGDSPAPGVTIERLEVREVVATFSNVTVAAA